MLVEPAPLSGRNVGRAPDRGSRVPTAVAWLVRLTAFSTVIDILISQPHDRIDSLPISRLADAVADGIGFAAAVASAAVMLLLAGALRRGKRRAWAILVGVAAIGAMAHLLNHRWVLAMVNVLLFGVLIWARRDFTARSQQRSRFAALRVLLVMLVISTGAGLLLVRDTTAGAPFAHRLSEVLFGLIGFAPDLHFREPVLSELTQVALTSLGALTALLTLAALLAPAQKVARLSAEDDRRLRRLLDGFGERDSLGYFCLRRDKSVVFSRSGKAAVVHRVVGGVSLASGDPIGDPEAWPGAIDAWLDEADTFGWVPAVLGASETGALAMERAGLDAFEFGDEAVIELGDFCLDGRSMRAVRQAVNRVKRAGYTLQVNRQQELEAGQLADVTRAAEALRGGEVERGFSMALGRLGDPADPNLVIAQVRDAGGDLMAVLGFVPWGVDGLSLDIMRRARGSENGTIEFAVVGVAEAVRAAGVRRLSLNFAVFRAVFDRGSRVGAGPMLRIWHRILLFVSRWFQIESLYRSNAKYQPAWVPRFICFRRASDLPRVGLAALEAEAFLVRPKLSWLAR